MSQAAIIQAVRDRFDTLVATPESLRVIHDNAPEPVSRVQSWVRFSVQVDGHEQVSMGQRRYRMTGTASAIVFAPIAKGDAGALAIADLIVTAYQGQRISSPSVKFQPAPGVIGVSEQDESWCKSTVQIPFFADTVET
tara:strand:- start:1590 stop:2003 length:414 start_codon:yes stop_codon:yes gene_type:complete